MPAERSSVAARVRIAVAAVTGASLAALALSAGPAPATAPAPGDASPAGQPGTGTGSGLPPWARFLQRPVTGPGAVTERARAEVTPVPADPGAKVVFYWGLARDEAGARKQLARASTPGLSGFRRFTSTTSIGAEYGATRAAIKAVERFLAGSGISASLDPTGVFVRLIGTVASFEAKFGMSLETVTVSGVSLTGPDGTPSLPESLRGVVTETVWVSTSQGPVTDQARLRPAPVNQGTPVGGCPSLRANKNTMMFGQAIKAYGTNVLRGQTANGRNAKIGIVSMGDGMSPQAAADAGRCFGYKTSGLQIVTTDGMNGPLAPQQGEGDLDYQMVRSILPNARRVHVFEAVGSPTAQFLPIAKAFGSSARPDVLSISYGECEPVALIADTPDVLSLANSIYVRLGLAGTSVLVASGDTGSAGCLRLDPQAGMPAVSFPASSPYVTAVGGTRIVLRNDNTRKNEYPWNDSSFSGGNYDPASLAEGGGGGGQSQMFKAPVWQPRSITGVKARAVPDFAAHASGAPAWPVKLFTGAWTPIWGTSSSTPFSSATMALIAAEQRAAGQPPLGFLNPWLYSLGGAQSGAFFDVVQGSNDINDNGCCRAKPGYDRASGIGSPNFARLAALVP